MCSEFYGDLDKGCRIPVHPKAKEAELVRVCFPLTLPTAGLAVAHRAQLNTVEIQLKLSKELTSTKKASYN